MPANIVVPEVGESIVDARVAKWLRKAGDLVAVGDPLVELETDKIDVEVAAPQGGVLARIAHQDGADVKVGDVLGVIEEAATARAAAGEAAASPAEAASPKQPPRRREGADASKTSGNPDGEERGGSAEGRHHEREADPATPAA